MHFAVVFSVVDAQIRDNAVDCSDVPDVFMPLGNIFCASQYHFINEPLIYEMNRQQKRNIFALCNTEKVKNNTLKHLLKAVGFLWA